jgi:hypothetical protein
MKDDKKAAAAKDQNATPAAKAMTPKEEKRPGQGGEGRESREGQGGGGRKGGQRQGG